MAVFADADEVYKYVGGMFNEALAADGIASAVKGTDLVVRMIVTDPDCEMVVDFPGAKVLFGPDGAGIDCTVTLTMTADDSNRLWQGKLNFAAAMAQRKIKMQGNKLVAMKLLPLTGPLFERYVQTLKAENREDLLLP